MATRGRLLFMAIMVIGSITSIFLGGCASLPAELIESIPTKTRHPLLPTIVTFTPAPPTLTPTPVPPTRPTTIREPVPTQEARGQIKPPTALPPTPTPPPLTLAPPTPVPGFPQQVITGTNVAGLQLVRELGYGQAERAIFSPDDSTLVVATTAGLAWFGLPSLSHLRFDSTNDSIDSMVFRPDGQVLATVRGAKTTLRRARDGEIIATLSGDSPIFSADSQRVITREQNDATDVETINLWSSENATLLAAISGTSPVLNATGTLLAVEQEDEETGHPITTIYQTKNGSKLAVVEGNSAVFSPDGVTIATVQGGESFASTLVWHAEEGMLLKDLSGKHPAFSPDGQWLITATVDEIKLWDLVSDEPARVQPLGAEGETLESLTFDGSSQKMSGFERDTPNSRVHVWTIVGDQLIKSFAVEAEPRRCNETILVDFADGGEGVVSGVELLRAADGSTLYEEQDLLFPDERHAQQQTIACTRDGSYAALVSVGGTVRLVDLTSGAPHDLRLASYQTIAFSADGWFLAAASNGSVVDLWHVGDGTFQKRLYAPGEEGFHREPYDLWFTPEGHYLMMKEHTWLYGGAHTAAIRWNYHTETIGTEIWGMDVGEAPRGARGWAYETTTGLKAWVDETNYVQFQRADGSLLTLTEASNAAMLHFSPDHSMLAIGQRYGDIQLIRIDTGYLYDTLNASGTIEHIAFSPDGSLLAAVRSDGTLIVWRIGSQQPIAYFTVGGNDMLQFTAQSQMLVAGGDSGVRFFRLRDGTLQHHLHIAADGIALSPTQQLFAMLHQGRVLLWGIP